MYFESSHVFSLMFSQGAFIIKSAILKLKINYKCLKKVGSFGNNFFLCINLDDKNMI